MERTCETCGLRKGRLIAGEIVCDECLTEMANWLRENTKEEEVENVENMTDFDLVEEFLNDINEVCDIVALKVQNHLAKRELTDKPINNN